LSAVAADLAGTAARNPFTRWAISTVLTLASLAVCLALTLLLIALIPATARETVTDPNGDEREVDRPYRYGEKIDLVLRTTWDKVLLPRPPSSATAAGYRNWIETLKTATPLLLTGLAVALAFQAGVLNIGGQGQFVAGATAATAVAVYWAAPPALVIPAYLCASLVGGAAVAGVAALLDGWRKVPVVLSTLLLNFVVLELFRYLLQGPMRARGDDGAFLDPQSPDLADAVRLPQVLATSPGRGLHVGLFIALGAAVLVAFLIRRTTLGFRLRVVGQNPVAARFAGMNVGRVSFVALALSGALAGLAGGVQVAGQTYRASPDMGTSGVGFAGIAVALLGRLSPAGVCCSALFFGLLDTAFKALERSDLEIQSSAGQAFQGALVLAVLAVTSPRWARGLREIRRREPA
jgi:simple sugar transport system permease protein